MTFREASANGETQIARLASLVDRATKLQGLRGLTEEELLEFGRLYRRAASELSHKRAYGLNETELQYLNWLVGRAYGLLYATEPSGWGGIRRFFSAELPQTLRRHGKLVGLSAAIFLGTALIGALLTLLGTDLLDVLSPSLAEAVKMIAARHAEGRDWLPSDFRPMASSMVMSNNIQVSFFAFSGGILLCLGTLLVLVQNGLILGALAAGVSQTPASVHFWGFVAPHGVIELPAIVISAAAGLLLGLAVIEPGEYSRLDALRIAGREAAVIMLGVVVFLVFAGIIEGLFSPTTLPPVVKFFAAAIFAALFWGYILFAGRPRDGG